MIPPRSEELQVKVDPWKKEEVQENDVVHVVDIEAMLKLELSEEIAPF